MNTATQTAIESYEKDARFRATAQSVVARVIQDHGPVDPECADRDAHEIAIKVAVLLLQHIYDEDTELNGLRVERDAYKKLALEGLRYQAPIPLLRAID